MIQERDGFWTSDVEETLEVSDGDVAFGDLAESEEFFEDLFLGFEVAFGHDEFAEGHNIAGGDLLEIAEGLLRET